MSDSAAVAVFVVVCKEKRAERDATFVRRAAKPKPGSGLISRRSASGSSRSPGPAKTSLTLERHGAPTLAGLRERILARFCCLAAAITLNHQLGRPSRALVND
jgi:hypothetical protein